MDRITNRPEYTPAPDIRNTETDLRHKTQGTDFQDALKTAMNPMTSSSMQTLKAQTPLPPPRAMGMGTLFDSSVEDRTRNLVSLMDHFSSALLNPIQDLKDLEPMVEKLGRDAESLFKESAETEEDPAQTLARRTALLARVEVEKFRRGDFF
ncbi:hypothetical protein OOT00_00665 [Desulfobotulus sp. H1]|uniref:Uncharacterized protein n=1 Tax=Desulfobotulus pelophilus TaxID=2823377 RepID=A0ABT3N5Q6_9BACT|nr:hypothetical protein [Desulfobotulus pelophilus]MCW7752491.1 hypothetical protein [Desulfobotulus pelophilus]